MAQTKAPPPRKGIDDDGYDDEQYQMASAGGGGGGQVEIDSSLVKPGASIASGSSRTHDNSRELKKQNASGSNALDLTTPRLYEIHTRPDGDYGDPKRSDYREHFGKPPVYPSLDSNSIGSPFQAQTLNTDTTLPQRRRPGEYCLHYSAYTCSACSQS